MLILLADDHGLFRESIKCWIEEQDDGLTVETAASYEEVLAQLEDGLKAKLMALDLRMPGMNGVQSIRDLRAQWPDIPVLVISANDDPLVIRDVIEAGASGFVSKSGHGEEVLEAIHQTLAGKSHFPSGVMSGNAPRFSDKQAKVLRFLADGCSNREIADKAFLTEGTVKQYVSEILSKLGVDNRVQAALRARDILSLNK